MKSPLPIKIDNASSIPIYKQIASCIEKLILNGELEMGHFLPSERALADQMQVARGTVKKAYEELSNRGLVSASIGQGTKVEIKENNTKVELKDMDELLVRLKDKGLSFGEIKTIINGKVIKQQVDKIPVAIIDCNKEVLSIFRQQLKNLPIDITSFLLGDVLDYQIPNKTLKSYPLIITTSTHYDRLSLLLNEREKELMEVAVAPDRKTIMSITLLTNKINANSSSLGLIGESKRFIDIMREQLLKFSLEVEDNQVLYKKDFSSLEDFLQDKEAIIMPPFYTMFLENKDLDTLYNFKAQGGEIIVFNYIIEKGSLLYIEEKLKDLKQ